MAVDSAAHPVRLVRRDQFAVPEKPHFAEAYNYGRGVRESVWVPPAGGAPACRSAALLSGLAATTVSAAASAFRSGVGRCALSGR